MVNKRLLFSCLEDEPRTIEEVAYFLNISKEWARQKLRKYEKMGVIKRVSNPKKKKRCVGRPASNYFLLDGIVL